MNTIHKLTQVIRSHSESELCYGTIVTLGKIDKEAAILHGRIDDLNKNINEILDGRDVAADKFAKHIEESNAEIGSKNALIEYLQKELKQCIDSLGGERPNVCEAYFVAKRALEASALSGPARKDLIQQFEERITGIAHAIGDEETLMACCEDAIKWVKGLKS